MRRAARIGGGVLVSMALLFGAAAVWLRWRDPVAALSREPTAPLRSISEPLNRSAGRLLSHVTLEGARVGRIRCFVSLPDPLPRGRVPVMLVAAGHPTDARTANVFRNPGPNAVVWFEWPFPDPLPQGGELAWRLPELRREALRVPGQIDALLRWATQQPWADPDRVSLLGFSLGALVVPAAQRLAQERGANVGWTVLAYGGAPISAMLEANARIPSWIRLPFGAVVDLLLRPAEPSIHLPALHGRFLLLAGRADPSVPPPVAERMRALTPTPRTIVVVEGEHIGMQPKRRKLVETVVEITQSWLVQQGAIVPPGRAQRAAAAG